jgi:hypothetical protein
MINFKQFLTEARMAPLYHGTRLEHAANIIYSNILKTGSSDTAYPGKHHIIVSLSRDFKVAQMIHDRDRDIKVVFELDQQKLTTRYKIQPYNYFNWVARRIPASGDYNSRNEFEEAVLSDIKDLDSYLIKIHISTSLLEELRRIDVRERGNMKYKKLLTHPKLYNYDAKEWVNR